VPTYTITIFRTVVFSVNSMNLVNSVTFPFPSHYLPSRTVVLAIVFTGKATLKMSMMMVMMMMMITCCR